jgi:hypothetical protein
MSLSSQIEAVAQRNGAECKAIRGLINGNQQNLNALNTATKTSLVAAINEVFASGGSGLSDARVRTRAFLRC